MLHVSTKVQEGPLLHSRKIPLLIFFGILLVELSAFFYNSPVDLFTILMAGSLFLLTMFKPFWGVWAFVALVPFLNGWFVVKGIGGTSLAFTAVYLAWFPRYLIKDRSSYPESPTSFFTFILAIIVFLNLCLCSIRFVEWPMPSRYWLEWVSSFPFFTQSDPLWQVNAALILLKGMVLFRMVELEIAGQQRWLVFTRTIYVQAICIAGFALFQLVNFKANGANYLGLSLPFSDIHSFGSTVVLLFILFSIILLNTFGNNRPNNDTLHRRARTQFELVFIGLFVFLLFLLCLYSSSRVTWIAMGMLLVFIFVQMVKSKRIIIYAVASLLLVCIVGNFFVPKLISSTNQSLYRLGTFFNVKDLTNDTALRIRYNLWSRSLMMVKEYPLTGIGIGNVYRNIQFYKDDTDQQLEAENSHNYYLQIAAELGVPALILFLCVLLTLYPKQAKGAIRNKQNLSGKIFVRPFRYGLGAYLLTMLTGHPLLLSSQQFLFWPVVAIISKGQWLKQENTQNRFSVKTRILKQFGVLSLLLYIFGFGINVYKHEPWTMPSTYGFYSMENWNGTDMRWMSGKAEYYLPAKRKKLILKVVAQPFNSRRPEGLTLKVSINNIEVDRVHFFEGESKILSYGLDSINGQKIKVNFEVDRVFRPISIGLSRDSRLLGIAIGELNRLPVVPVIPVIPYLLLQREPVVDRGMSSDKNGN